jgi:hypothetical protein
LEQRAYYRKIYEKLFVGISPADATHKLARYLSGVLVRNNMGGRGDDPSWGGKFIQVTFHAPIPGAPPETVRHYVRYRTLPMSMATTHIPPWRAKGYLKMAGRKATPKIASWHDLPPGLVPQTATLTDGKETVEVKADYLIAD